MTPLTCGSLLYFSPQFCPQAMCANLMSGEIWRLSPTTMCTVILEVGYTAIWGCLPPAVEVGCGEALPLYNLQHLCPFGPQGCALFPREICSQGTIVKAPWKSTQPFPSPFPVLLAHRVVLIFWNAKHNREGTQHKSQGQIMQSCGAQPLSVRRPLVDIKKHFF